MTGGAARGALRAAIPAPLRRLAGRGRQLHWRLGAWPAAFAEAEGATPEDARVLALSRRASRRDIFRDTGRWREPVLAEEACVRAGDGLVFRCRAGSDDFVHALSGRYADLLGAVAPVLRPGATVIDAGANIGGLALRLARRVAPGGRVIAVEMMPDTARRLRANIALNALDGAVTVVERALTDRAGGTATATRTEGTFGQASIARQAGPQRMEIAATTLDALSGDLGEIALLKLDLEGAEPLALAGGARTLARCRAVLAEERRVDGGIVSRMLQEAGFEVARIDGLNVLGTRRAA